LLAAAKVGPEGEATMNAALRLNHMSVQVRNLEASAKFYSEVLLLPEIECRARRPNIRWFGIGDVQAVHLIEGEFGATFVTRSTHFCITSSSFEGTLDHFRKKRVAFCNASGEAGAIHVRADGVRSVYLQDPDGYWVEISQEF
jgi:lactoylglutathione lyase